MNTPYYIIDMNIPGFTVPASISSRHPSNTDKQEYAKAKAIYDSMKDKEGIQEPSVPQTITIPNVAVCHDILKTAIQMAVPEGSPETLRRIQKIHKAIESGMNNGGQLVLSVEDHRWLQSKYAKADKWNTMADVCNTVIAIQNTISRAALVTTTEK